MLFQPRHWNGHTLMDGGTAWGVNVSSAINQCLELVDDPSDIIIDILICGYYPPVRGTVSGKAGNNYQTAQDIKSYYSTMGEVLQDLTATEGIQYRYLFQMQNVTCPEDSAIDSRNSTTWCLQEAGRRDAKTMLNLGQDKITAALKEWFDEKQL